MTPAIRKMVLILALAAAFVLCGCQDEIPHWSTAEGDACYSTMQKGCTDALIWPNGR